MVTQTEKTTRPTEVAEVKHFIDGRYVDGVQGSCFVTNNPATNEPVGEVAEGHAADVDRAVNAARRAFAEGPWRTMKTKERAEVLRRVADGIDAHTEEIARLETLDTGLPISQTLKAQIPRSADNFRFFAEMATHMDGETYPVDGEFLNYTIRQPVGVAGLITPWNTPFMLETWKIAPCLAAGNTCVLKPAEWSPLSASKLGEILREAGVPDGVFNVVNGFGETAGAALVAHPEVNLISFTGETTTGQEIMRNGAATLKRFSLELGGKSPMLVFPDADLDRALDAAVFGGFSLNGERCTASSRLFVQQEIHDEFVARLAERARNVRVGDPFEDNTEVGPLIHPDHLDRVMSYVDIGRQEGATVAAGGGRPPGLEVGNYLEPTVLTNVSNSMRVAQEEIFGPVLCVIPFETEEEVVRLANDVRYGLAAYIWTGNVARAHRVARALESGMVWVNSQNVRELRAPFGGVKDSGTGREGGYYSFEFYTELKNVCVAMGEHRIPRLGATPRTGGAGPGAGSDA